MTRDDMAIEIARSIQLGRPTLELENTGYYFSYIHAATWLAEYVLQKAKILEVNSICLCAKIQAQDKSRHFKGCPERVEKS